MKLDRIVKGGNVVTPAGTFVGDVGIAGEKIAALGADLEPGPGTDVIDATGHHVLPGVLDVHVHLELPFCGTVSADDYRTGTRAGARGGVTTVIDFAIPYAGDSLGQAADNWMREGRGKVADRLHLPHLHHPLERAQGPDQGDGGPRVHHLQGVHDLRVGGVAVGRPRPLRHAGADAGVRHHAPGARRVGAGARRADRAAPHAGADGALRRAAPSDDPARTSSRPRRSSARCSGARRPAASSTSCTCPRPRARTSCARPRRAACRCSPRPARSTSCWTTRCSSGEDGHLFACCPQVKKPKDVERLWQGPARRRGLGRLDRHLHLHPRAEGDVERATGPRSRWGCPGLETLLPLVYTHGVLGGRLTLEELCMKLSTNPARIMGLVSAEGRDHGRRRRRPRDHPPDARRARSTRRRWRPTPTGRRTRGGSWRASPGRRSRAAR